MRNLAERLPAECFDPNVPGFSMESGAVLVAGVVGWLTEKSLPLKPGECKDRQSKLLSHNGWTDSCLRTRVSDVLSVLLFRVDIIMRSEQGLLADGTRNRSDFRVCHLVLSSLLEYDCF